MMVCTLFAPFFTCAKGLLYTSIHSPIDLSTARPKWLLDGLALSDHLLYSLVNHAYANRYTHHLVRKLVSNIIMERYGFHIIISIQASDA